MTAIPSGADELANALLVSLTAGKDFNFPDVDLSGDLFKQPVNTGPLYEPVDKIDFNDLTTGEVGGSGVFDKLMVSLVNHLKVEFAANRISGAEYTKAYIGVIAAALQTSQQFLLAKDQAYWSALLVQAQGRTAEVETIRARVELETARVSLVRMQYEAATAEVNYGLAKIKISTEDATYDNLTKQGANLVKQGEGLDFTNENILPKQKDLLTEQVEVQRSQTLDTRMDGTTITGTAGKQKELYGQQIISYKRDSETKFLKLFNDAWITQKTIDEGLLPPDQYTNANFNEVLMTLRANLDLGS